MSSYNHGAAPIEVYQPPQTAYPPPGTGVNYSIAPAYAAAPPPGYPVNGATPYAQQVPLETKQRGHDGFWKGCVAALCCCFVFEACCE